MALAVQDPKRLLSTLMSLQVITMKSKKEESPRRVAGLACSYAQGSVVALWCILHVQATGRTLTESKGAYLGNLQ